MGYMDNFKTSLNQVFKLPTTDRGPDEPPDNRADTDEGPVYEEPMKSEAHGSPDPSAARVFENREKVFPHPTERDSVISSDTRIVGKVITDGNLLIGGEVEGDISAKGDVKVKGKVKGNISANKVELNESSVFGNVRAGSSLSIDSGSEIIGDIESTDTSIDGRIKGNVLSSGDMVCKKNSFILGNVSSDSISIEKGAVVCGEIQIKCPENAEEIFSKYFSTAKE